MVCDATILNLDGTDLVATLTGSNLVLTRDPIRRLSRFLLDLLNLLTKQSNGLGLIRMLASIVLTEHHLTGGAVHRADCSFTFVAMLAARPGSLGGLKGHFGQVQLKFAGFRISKDRDRECAGLHSTFFLGVATIPRPRFLLANLCINEYSLNF